jgi:hypothetical protein
MLIIPAIQEAEVGESWSEVDPGESMRLYLKNKLKLRTGDVAQVVECLPSKHEVLN